MSTLSDVARLANVSTMTVSRVINNRGPISEHTRQKVMEAVEALDYRPNMLAKALATRRTQLIAYVVSNLGNTFFSGVSRGVESVCAAQGYSVILFDATNAQRMHECLDMLVDRCIDGAIFHHLCVTPGQAASLKKNGVMCVTIDNEEPLADVSSVDSDDYAGAGVIARHLLEKGHERLGLIHGRIGSRQDAGKQGLEYIESFQRRIWQNRTSGFLDCLKARGLEPVFMAEGSGTVEKAFRSGAELLLQALDTPHPPTAFYCENDLIALGALSECLSRGIAVPGEIAIAGHDGLDMSMMLYPRVTTMFQPQYDMGLDAARQLIAQIEGKAEILHSVIPPRLFKGDTT